MGGNGGGLYAFASVSLTNSPIRNNRASGNGGGIYNDNSSVTLTNSDVISNAAGASGGGVHSFYNTNLHNSDLISNTAVGDGGGIYGTQGVDILNANVFSNTAGGDGGAFYSESEASVTNSPLLFNRAAGIGGGFYAFSSAFVTNSDVISNDSGSDGGGIYANNSVNLSNSDLFSNTAEGNGGGLYSDLAATLNNSDVAGNSAAGRGGGVYNSGKNNLSVVDSDFTSNRAVGDGGGLFINVTSTVTLNNSDFLSNTSMARGGGIFANTDSEVTLTNSEIRANTSITNGGGIFNNSTAILTDVEVIANTTLGHGGGLYNNYITTLTNVEVISNTAVISGGGIHNTGSSTITLTLADLISNHADGDGGGFYTSNTATFSNTQILFNTATGNGGGLYNNSGTITATLSNMIANRAGADGGALYQANGQITLTQAQILANEAGERGGATQQISGTTTIQQSCIVNNTDTAVDLVGGDTIDATNNWWGAPDGPGGVALGAGDSVTNSVTFAPFATSTLLGCPTRSTDISFAKSVSPAGNLLPGQPLTFTLVVTNHDTLGIYNLRLVDLAPAAFILSEAETSGVAFSPEAGGYRIPSVDGGAVATFYLRGVLTRTLSADTVLTNTATISNVLTSLQTSSASLPVNVPLLRWSQASYTAGEEIGIFSATVTISPTNPYTITTAQAGVPSPTVANITFTPGSSSQPVGVLIPNDAFVFTRTIPLNLFAAIGAAIDAAGDDAIVVTTEDDDAPAIIVEKSANVAEAWVGDTITYTYRITNTGNVTLTTVVATDDMLGAVAGLAGQLIPGATRTTTLTYTVQGADWPGPLVNSVTVTGTDIFVTAVNDNDSASVALTTPAVTMSKHANPAGNLLPGQPLTYTITITNQDVRAIPNLTITDTLPSGFEVSSVITTGPSISLSDGNYVIAQLPAAQVATLAFVGVVDANLTDNLVLNNTATLTQALKGVLTATTSSNVVVPLVTWSSATYTTAENNGSYTATLFLSPANPYAAVSVGVIITDSSPVTQAIIFPPNSDSQPVVVSFANDGVVLPRTIDLQSQSPTGAALGGGSSGPFSAITLLESDAAPAITVEKSANLTQAWAGDTITYTYRITNTGNVTLTTVVATDDKLGTVADLAGQLYPGETRTATLTYVVQQGDLPGPLVNTVTVTGTDIFANEVSDGASASVIMLVAAPALTVDKSANTALAFVGDTITYTYRITNTGNVTLTTIVATDDKLGTVADLAGQLYPGETRTATLTYVVQQGDLPGPLVNTVTVTGTDLFATEVSDDASASVAFDSPSVTFDKVADPDGDLLPGQPLVYTLVVTNEENRVIDDLFVTDELPVGFVLSETNTSGAAISFNGTSYVIDQLPALGVATIEFVGVVDDSLTADLVLENTATLTHSLISLQSASTSNDVVVPTVSWSDESYVTDESSGTFTATLLLSPANPYASVSVNVIITEAPSALQAAALQAAALQTATVQVITFPPNSTSQPVVVSFANDGVVVPRTITLQLQSLSGGALGGGANGSFAAIEIIEDNDAPALVVSASVNPAQAVVGETITYTYRITNTGNVTFTTIAATTDKFSAVASLAGQLIPGATRIALQSYTVLASDLPGPLVNTLTVTGTDIFNTNIAQSATTTVNINDPTALPETDQPQQPQLQLYLPSLEAVKE